LNVPPTPAIYLLSLHDALPISLPADVTVRPATVKIDTVPSLRLATSARVPSPLNDTPDAPRPACTVAITAGGVAFKSITDTVSRSEEHTSELQSRGHLVCRLLL